jgi:hypothetical protein
MKVTILISLTVPMGVLFCRRLHTYALDQSVTLIKQNSTTYSFLQARRPPQQSTIASTSAVHYHLPLAISLDMQGVNLYIYYIIFLHYQHHTYTSPNSYWLTF